MSISTIDLATPSASKAGAVRSRRAALLKSIKRGIARIGEEIRLRRDTDALLALDDRLLADIGVRRSELEYAVRHGRRLSDTPAHADR
jgi:uncharacterized protein YjiS (DUF1127 family)